MNLRGEYGKTSLDRVEEVAIREGISMYEVIKNAASYDLNRVHLATREFVSCIDTIIQEADQLTVSGLTKRLLKDTGYTKALELEDTKEAENRIENLEEFLTVTMEFDEEARTLSSVP